MCEAGVVLDKVRPQPCSTCPYRRDVPSGVWAFEEYERLRPYDRETFAQPLSGFSCHVNPEAFCCGWAVVHSSRGHEFELLALRLAGVFEVPEVSVSLFPSGAQAADHGQAEVRLPSPAAVEVGRRLLRKYPRLRPDG
jgi:hypothetical protein